MAAKLKRIELIFYMELEESLDLRQQKRQIEVAAQEAIGDCLHKISDATIQQARIDNWSDDMYPYNRDDETPLMHLLEMEKKK